MPFISLLLFTFLSIFPQSDFICDKSDLKAQVYNNLNGDYTLISDLEKLDLGAFIVIKWRDFNIMLPRTFNDGEISFTDRKWWWSYQDKDNPLDLNHPKFRKRLSSGKILDYSCDAVSYEKKETEIKSLEDSRLT